MNIVLAGSMVLAASLGAFLWIRSIGEKLRAPEIISNRPTARLAVDPDFVLVHVLLALLAILIVARLLGMLFDRLHQPPVIGEIIAGILLGPSLLGRLSPTLFARLFPADMLPFLSVIAQIGVILYMFLVGVELDIEQLRNRLDVSLGVAQASIAAPFLIGSLMALWIYPVLSTEGVPFTQFALFMGVAMSVTAFPVLARILTDRKMQKSPLGALALGCAAANDVAAWCLLAVVVSIARSHVGQSLITIELTACFVALVFFVVKPAASWLARKQEGRETSQQMVVVICVVLFLAALATALIGIHALFGAFLIGLVIPHDSRLAADIQAKLKDSVVVVLLPSFFAFTGLRLHIDLLRSSQDWLILLVIVAGASLGKIGGSFVAGRFAGLGNREAAALGVLMNTRGLMELIILNVGLDLGIISPALFAMLVLMAVVTTLATVPILTFLKPERDELALVRQ
jgi:Kef-type K+ transport system membrane component KefB